MSVISCFARHPGANNSWSLHSLWKEQIHVSDESYASPEGSLPRKVLIASTLIWRPWQSIVHYQPISLNTANNSQCCKCGWPWRRHPGVLGWLLPRLILYEVDSFNLACSLPDQAFMQRRSEWQGQCILIPYRYTEQEDYPPPKRVFKEVQRMTVTMHPVVQEVHRARGMSDTTHPGFLAHIFCGDWHCPVTAQTDKPNSWLKVLGQLIDQSTNQPIQMSKRYTQSNAPWCPWRTETESQAAWKNR